MKEDQSNTNGANQNISIADQIKGIKDEDNNDSSDEGDVFKLQKVVSYRKKKNQIQGQNPLPRGKPELN